MNFKTTPEKALIIVCNYFKISKSEIIAKDRTKNITYARQIACYIIREFTDLPLKKIGLIINRDHTTVMHSINRIMIEKEIYKNVRNDLESIYELISINDCVVRNVDLLSITKLNTLSQAFLN
jgi:chromosomal replication initiation ATPase DnaA